MQRQMNESEQKEMFRKLRPAIRYIENKFNEQDKGGIRVWELGPPNKTEDAEFEIIQPKQLTCPTQQ
jgi:hypothetical protein